MAEVHSNEREFSGQVIVWLNEFIGNGSYPFENVTGETSVKALGETTKFPDVQIWLNRATKQGFCGWELKTPLMPANDSVLLENAANKARAMGADYFVTWNMRNAILWRTPQDNTQVTAEDKVREYPPIYQISKPEDMWVKPNEILLKERAREILEDLKTIKYDGHLNQIEADTTFFVGRLHKSVDILYPVLSDALMQRVGGDNKFRRELEKWGRTQGIAKVDDNEFYQAVAKQIIYRLLVRILFYLTLQRQFRFLPELSISGLGGQAAGAHLKEVFARARELDWHAVFEEGLQDTIDLPDMAIYEINLLLNDLKRFNFGHMPHDVIGAVFEKLIPQQERHALGQYFTPENLVDFILAFCIRERDDKVLDPTCGTGTFLLRAYNKKMRHLGMVEHKQLLPQIWGVDIAHFPAELATINLFRQNLSDYANFPRIIVSDFFDVKPGDTFDFPPPKADLSSGFTKVKDPMPEFDAAVGNFPFIRQELIEKTIPHYKEKLENVIKRDWLLDYPEAFEILDKNRDAVLAEIKRNPDAVIGDVEFKLSGQADIYAYLFFHTGRFVKEGGRMGFITSNSWLDVAYGYELQKYMVNNFKIVAILESRCEPWFEDAAVNTVVTILERCSDNKEREKNIVSFVKVKKKLADLIPWDVKQDADKRWMGLDGLARKVEDAAYSEKCYDLKTNKCVLNGVATVEDDDFRIRLVKQSDLKAQLDTEQKTAKWGQYLRAPQVYFDLLNEHGDKFVPLNTVADIRRGFTTGINEFFYLDKETINHWGIEKQFLVPVLKSPKEFDSILIDSKKLDNKVFICPKSKEDLKKAGYFGALKYINWGEKQQTKGRQKTEAGVPWPKTPSVVNKPLWYNLGEIQAADFLCNRFFDLRFFFGYNPKKVIDDQTFYGAIIHNVNDVKIQSALVNTTINYLFVELLGRVSLGEGVLQYAVYEMEDLLTINPSTCNENDREKIINAFNKIAERSVKPIFEEVKMKDRQKLDSLVLEAMGLDPEKYLQPIYDGLTELVRERIELAAMRKQKSKSKVIKDIAKLTEQVRDELVNSGIKKFPDDFLSTKLKPQDCTNVSVPDVPLRLGHYFMGQQDVTGEGFNYTARSLEAAKYIIYAHKPGEYIVCLPNDDIIVTKAVVEYECYLKELFKKLNTEILNRTFDHKQAESISKRIFEELGLPLVGG
jgi:type I restriction-modification system DNA methylase subunit